jgi:hypothetical protein
VRRDKNEPVASIQTNAPGPEAHNSSQESMRINSMVQSQDVDEEDISFESAPVNISSKMLGVSSGVHTKT